MRTHEGTWGPGTVPQVAQPNVKTSLSQARPHCNRGADTTGPLEATSSGCSEPLHCSLLSSLCLLSESLGLPLN